MSWFDNWISDDLVFCVFNLDVDVGCNNGMLTLLEPDAVFNVFADLFIDPNKGVTLKSCLEWLFDIIIPG